MTGSDPGIQASFDLIRRGIGLPVSSCYSRGDITTYQTAWLSPSVCACARRLASHSPNVRWTCLSRQSRASGGEATSQRLCPKFTTCEGVHPLVGHIGGALAVILGRSSRLAAGLLAGKMAMFFERADWTVRCASESLGIRDIETARRSGERRARRHLWLQRCRTGVPIV